MSARPLIAAVLMTVPLVGCSKTDEIKDAPVAGTVLTYTDYNPRRPEGSQTLEFHRTVTASDGSTFKVKDEYVSRDANSPANASLKVLSEDNTSTFHYVLMTGHHQFVLTGLGQKREEAFSNECETGRISSFFPIGAVKAVSFHCTWKGTAPAGKEVTNNFQLTYDGVDTITIRDETYVVKKITMRSSPLGSDDPRRAIEIHIWFSEKIGAPVKEEISAGGNTITRKLVDYKMAS